MEVWVQRSRINEAFRLEIRFGGTTEMK